MDEKMLFSFWDWIVSELFEILQSYLAYPQGFNTYLIMSFLKSFEPYNILWQSLQENQKLQVLDAGSWSSKAAVNCCDWDVPLIHSMQFPKAEAIQII